MVLFLIPVLIIGKMKRSVIRFLFFQDNQAVFTADIIAWDGVVKAKDATNSLITPMIFELVYDGSVVDYIYCEMQVV